MSKDELRLLAELIRTSRWAALATLGRDGPEASWVAYAFEPDFSFFYLHLSRLAAHTRNLLADPRAGLAISQPDRAGLDPQQLARVGLQGRVAPIARDVPDYPRAAALYQQRLPDSEPLFGFGDFLLLRLEVERARFVGGFARAHTLSGEGLRKAAGAD